MKPDHFLALYRELIDENPFAVRAVLRILEVTFTDSIPTLAVSCEAQPRFLVNPDFVATHCKTESHVKAVIVHEFLHVLLRQTESSGPLIWRGQRAGLGNSQALADLEKAANDPARQCEKSTLDILRRHVLPDPKAKRTVSETRSIQLPVLSSGDRRAFVRSLWDPILPQSRWDSVALQKGATAQVYLDVSGSMNSEMPALIALLARLAGHIRKPFWAFSDEVVPARIQAGRLITSTTGGTSMACVLRHVIETRPRAAVVVTDGFIEGLDPSLVAAARSAARLHAIIARHGSPAALRAAGIPYTQLQRYPS